MNTPNPYKIKVTEHQIQTQCNHFLEMNHYYVERMNAGAISQVGANGRSRKIMLHDPGTPDALAHKRLKDGTTHLMRIEYKVPGNKPTFLQQSLMDRLQTEYGCECHVITDMEELKPLIRW